jgi:hypothetical protein
MSYDSITVDISKCKNEKDVDKVLRPWLQKNYDVKAMTKDIVILTKLLAK